MRRLVLVLSLAAFFVPAANAAAVSVIVGPPTLQDIGGFGATCYGIPSQQPCDTTVVQTGTATGYSAVPGDGVITSWRALAYVSNDGKIYFRIARPIGSQLRGIFTSPAGANLNGTTPNPVNVAVQVGDHIGLDAKATGPNASVTNTATGPGNETAFFYSHLPDNSTLTPDQKNSNSTISVNATLELYAPVVNAVSPNSGAAAGGETVTITGDHLANASAVTFGGNPAAIVSNTNTQLTVTAPAGAAGTVEVRVTTLGGDSLATDSARYTYSAPPDGGGSNTPPPTGNTPPPAVDAVAPVLSAFVVSPSAFQAANTGPAFTSVVGGRVVYRLSEAGPVTFTVEKKLAGRKKGKSCVTPKRAPRGKRCFRYSSVKGSFTVPGDAGLNTFRFMARLAGKALKPGNYRLIAVAKDAAGNSSKAVRHPFRVKK